MEEQFLVNFIEKFQGEEELFTKFLLALRKGNNKVFYNYVTEHFLLDDSWVDSINATLYSVETIVRNPRRFIKEEYEVVAVEKAKKISTRTVRHLSSHTQNIQAVLEDNVRPSKVLVGEIEEDLAIYENRFVYALVDRLSNFIERRYTDIFNRAKNLDYTTLQMQSAFNMGQSEFDCKLEIKVKEPSRDAGAMAKLWEQLQKVKLIRKRLRIISSTDFCKQMSRAKPVKPPIQKTNLLRGDNDYRNCYQLWLFISAYNTLGYSVDVKEKMLTVDGDYFDDLTVVTALGLQSLITDGNMRRDLYERLPATQIVDRNFKVVQTYQYNADFGADTKQEGENAVNEYYFRRMRDELQRAVNHRTQLEEKKNLDLNFRHFFRSIATINGEMYKDVITSEYEKLPKGKSVIQKKEAAAKNQRVLLKRYHQLVMLQRQELEKTLKLEKREILKLEKLEKDLAQTKKKRLEQIEREKQRKLKELESQQQKATLNADNYERDLRFAEMEKEADKEAAKRQRQDDAKRAREYKKYLELKEKFDGETD